MTEPSAEDQVRAVLAAIDDGLIEATPAQHAYLSGAADVLAAGVPIPSHRDLSGNETDDTSSPSSSGLENPSEN